MKTETKLIRDGSQSKMWVVIVDGREVGTVEKFKDRRGDHSPHILYRGIGRTAQFVGHADTLQQAAAQLAN